MTVTGISEDKRLSLRDRLYVRTGQLFFPLFFFRSPGVWAFAVLTIVSFVARQEITPGRELFKLGVPAGYYYGILALLGAVAGFLGGERRLLGVLAGAVAAVGALAAVSLLLRYVPQPPVEQIWLWVNVLAMMVGFLPGVVLYAVVANLQERSATNAAAYKAEVAAAKAQVRLQRRRREHGLSEPE